MLADLIIILISTVSITGQDRACWSKRENTKYHGLYHSGIGNFEKCRDACETIYVDCWIFYYSVENWYPCHILTHTEEQDPAKFEESINTNSYILDRNCYAKTPVRPCWTHKLGLKYIGLHNSWSTTLHDCLDECQTQYEACFIVNYAPEHNYPCWYNKQAETSVESKFLLEIKINTYLIDRSCLTSTAGPITTTTVTTSMATTETAEDASATSSATDATSPSNNTIDRLKRFFKILSIGIGIIALIIIAGFILNTLGTDEAESSTTDVTSSTLSS